MNTAIAAIALTASFCIVAYAAHYALPAIYAVASFSIPIEAPR